jgi:hypothetical protein
MPQRIDEQIGAAPAIKTELHLLKIGFKMLRRNPMPRTNYVALQKRKRVFDRVRLNVAVNVDLRLVLDRPMFLRMARRLEICGSARSGARNRSRCDQRSARLPAGSRPA